jgi:hypothetical protein
MSTTHSSTTKAESTQQPPGIRRHGASILQHSIRLLPWLGLLLVYALSGITDDRIGRGALPQDNELGRIEGEDTVGQTFTLEDDQLVAIRVRLAPGSARGTDPVTLHLRFPNAALPDLATATVPLDALTKQGTTTFAFDPVTLNFPPAVLTTTLRFDLEAPALAPGDGIVVFGDRDSYTGGEFFKGNTSVPAIDMAFEPIYRHRWIDSILPVSRMAHDKPGILGWPPFYALLAYICLVGLIFMLIRLWRASRSAVDDD